MVEEGSDLEYIARQHLTLRKYPVFKCFHTATSGRDKEIIITSSEKIKEKRPDCQCFNRILLKKIHDARYSLNVLCIALRLPSMYMVSRS